MCREWSAEELIASWTLVREDQLRETLLLVRCRSERVDPPGRIDRIVELRRERRSRGQFCERAMTRLGPEMAVG